MENLLLMGRKDNNIVVNPFVPNASFFYPPENIRKPRFSDVFRG